MIHHLDAEAAFDKDGFTDPPEQLDPETERRLWWQAYLHYGGSGMDAEGYRLADVAIAAYKKRFNLE